MVASAWMGAFWVQAGAEDEGTHARWGERHLETWRGQHVGLLVSEPVRTEAQGLADSSV